MTCMSYIWPSAWTHLSMARFIASANSVAEMITGLFIIMEKEESWHPWSHWSYQVWATTSESAVHLPICSFPLFSVYWMFLWGQFWIHFSFVSFVSFVPSFGSMVLMCNIYLLVGKVPARHKVSNNLGYHKARYSNIIITFKKSCSKRSIPASSQISLRGERLSQTEMCFLWNAAK